ncbi:protein mlo2-like isoform X2 [Cucumis melo var. makuwa]|uniref:Protein mlo2-like isoform X2 n=1 Tax=Cucumis melo var. makuwa TaxID=1194695 RepID=A0A5A7TH97_CUCMM|nr:protein mlo2-like isoform X2 [Cucumis melo var. makuwa]
MAGKGEGPTIGIDLGTDDLMVQCEGCKDWFHPSCMGMTIEEAKKLDHFLCSDCSSENEAKRSLNAFPVSPSAEAKNNNISSPIPIELGTVPLLQTLDLSNNRFSCPIPTFRGYRPPISDLLSGSWGQPPACAPPSVVRRVEVEPVVERLQAANHPCRRTSKIRRSCSRVPRQVHLGIASFTRVDSLSMDSIKRLNQVSGKGFLTTGPQIEAGNVVIHRGLHTPMPGCSVHRSYVNGLCCELELIVDGLKSLKVRVQRGADRRGARRMREGHMDASGFLYASADPLAKELGIKVVPTFKILKDKKVVKEVTGAKFEDLVHAIDTVRSS